MDVEWLQQILSCGDAEACLQFFAGATEEERRLASKTVLASLQGIEQERMFLHLVGASGRSPWRNAWGVALLASCSLEELKHDRMTLLPNSDYVCRVLADRRPEWIDDFPDAVLEFSRGYWPLVRRIVRDRLCRKPKSDIYVIGMLCSMRSWCAPEDKTLREELLEDPGLLDDEVWRLFEVAGSAECNLASNDNRSPTARRWDRTLIALSREGRLSRERLLDASLEALARDFRPYLAAWFSRFHELLEPTDSERVERTERYLALWSSRSPCMRQALVVAVAEGLSHKDVDVQEAVLRFLERFGDCDKDSTLAEAILRHRRHVAPSLRYRANGLLGVTPVPSEDRCADPAWDLSKLESRRSRLDPELAELAGVRRSLEAFQDGKLDLTTVEFDGTEIPRLNPDTPLKPMALLLVALGLAAREPAEYDVAVKVLTAAIEDGRVDDVKLGDILGQLLPTGLIYHARWAKTLGRVARTSPLHALVIRLALECSFRGTPSEQYRSFHALLDMYKELVFDARDGVHSESARRFLRQIKGTSKAAKTAKMLLDCKVRDLDDSVARIMPAVVQSRVERAERWTRWKRFVSLQLSSD